MAQNVQFYSAKIKSVLREQGKQIQSVLQKQGKQIQDFLKREWNGLEKSSKQTVKILAIACALILLLFWNGRPAEPSIQILRYVPHQKKLILCVGEMYQPVRFWDSFTREVRKNHYLASYNLVSLGFPEIPESAGFSALTAGADQLMKALLEKAPQETRSLLDSHEEILLCGYGLGSLVIKKLLLSWNERQNAVALEKIHGILLVEPPQSKEELVAWGESLGINLSLPECESLLQAYLQIPIAQKTMLLRAPQGDSEKNSIRSAPEAYLKQIDSAVQNLPKEELRRWKSEASHKLTQIQNEHDSLKTLFQQTEQKNLEQQQQYEAEIRQQKNKLQQQEIALQQLKDQESLQKKQWEEASKELQQEKQTLQQEQQELSKQLQQAQQQNNDNQQKLKDFQQLQEAWEQKNQTGMAQFQDLQKEGEQLKNQLEQLKKESSEIKAKNDHQFDLDQQEIHRLQSEVARLEKLKDKSSTTTVSEEVKWPSNEKKPTDPPKDIQEANQLFLEARSALNATQTPFGVFVGTGQVSEAKEKFHRILELYSHSTKAEMAAYDLATLYIQDSPKSDGALEIYKKCLSINPQTQFDVRVRIAMIYEAQEKGPEARFWYQEAIQKTQNNEERITAQQRIQQIK